MAQIYKVWPLVSGLRGLNGQGREIDLVPGLPGWMTQDAAFAARDAGHVKFMAGADPLAMKVPEQTKVARPDTEAPSRAPTNTSNDAPPAPGPAPDAEEPPVQEAQVTARAPGRRGFYSTKS